MGMQRGTSKGDLTGRLTDLSMAKALLYSLTQRPIYLPTQVNAAF